MFENVNSVQSHNLRNFEYNVYVPRPFTEAGKNTFHYQGQVFWNGLSNDAKSQINLRFCKMFI